VSLPCHCTVSARSIRHRGRSRVSRRRPCRRPCPDERGRLPGHTGLVRPPLSLSLRLPRIEDPPLLLRAFGDEDAPLIQDVSADPLIPLITTVPTEPAAAAARAFIARQHDRATRGEGYSFAIADLAGGAAVGQIGLWLRDLAQGRASIGYWVAGRHRGRGIARHALRMISRWGLGLPGVHRLELYVEPRNEASWRAAERAGYQREGLLRSWQAVGGERRDMYMYSLLPPGRR
jgi:ribosomal-protein-alanine N-acetyltransferase